MRLLQARDQAFRVACDQALSVARDQAFGAAFLEALFQAFGAALLSALGQALLATLLAAVLLDPLVRRRNQQHHTHPKLRENRDGQGRSRRHAKDGRQQEQIGFIAPIQRRPVPPQQIGQRRQKDDVVDDPVFSPAFHGSPRAAIFGKAAGIAHYPAMPAGLSTPAASL